MAAAANWESDICGCCSVKDCGCGCCCKLYCTGPCIWGAAIERAGLGSMPMCCIAVTCCSPCAIIKGRMDVAEKYGIKENLLMNVLMTCCCEPCSCIQVINQILVKENSTWGCCGVETSANGAPAIETMER